MRRQRASASPPARHVTVTDVAAPALDRATTRDEPASGRDRANQRPARDLTRGQSNVGTVTASAAVRALAAVFAGAAACAGVALILWALTPSGDATAGDLLGNSIAVYGLAHFMPMTLDGATLTLAPLAITAMSAALIYSSAGRARCTIDRRSETIHALIFVAVYAAGVTAVVAVAAPAATTSVDPVGAAVISALSVLTSLALHPTSWRRWWRDHAPAWAAAALLAGTRAAVVLVSGAAATVIVSIAWSFADFVALIDQSGSGSLADLAAVAVLCLAYLPNIVIDAVGYVLGGGFSIGAGHYSPLAVAPVDLPAVPLLAAVPAGDSGALHVAVFAVPLAAALIAGVTLVRRLRARADQWRALASTGVLVAAMVAIGTAAAAGGVTAGPWPDSGANPWLSGLLAAGFIVLVAGSCIVAGSSKPRVRPAPRQK